MLSWGVVSGAVPYLSVPWQGVKLAVWLAWSVVSVVLDVARVLMQPATVPLGYFLSWLKVPLGLLTYAEVFYIFLGTAAFFGFVAGSGLWVVSSTLVSLLHLESREDPALDDGDDVSDRDYDRQYTALASGPPKHTPYGQQGLGTLARDTDRKAIVKEEEDIQRDIDRAWLKYAQGMGPETSVQDTLGPNLYISPTSSRIRRIPDNLMGQTIYEESE